jgi:antirestriction protein ArdC
MRDIHQELTDKVVRAIESGLATGKAWTKPWHSAASSGLPTNHATRTRYRGMNVLQLWFAAADHGYEHGLWLTYKQAQAIGAQVRRGETGTQVIKFGQFERQDDATGEKKTGTYLKSYSVFNVAQCDGIDLPCVERPNLAQRIDHAEQVLQGVDVPIHYGNSEAFYRPSTDTVHMPHRDLFRPVGDATATEMFYSVAFHEVGHATGHEGRLARNLKARFGDATYAAEELVAELCSVFVMAEQGLAHEPKGNAQEYLAHWLGILRADSKALMTAAAKASAAAEFILKAGQGAAVTEAEPPLALAA